MPSVANLVSALLVVAAPTLVAIALLQGPSGGELFHYAPQWSDEVFNWHQVATFKAVGFEGGYYTAYEKEAPLSFSHFYNHGPVYPALLGMLARVFGWEFYSAPILNLIMVSLSLVFFIAFTRPNLPQLGLLGLVVATAWPMHLYMLTDMRVAFFCALGIILAGFFSRTINEGEEQALSGKALATFGVVIAFAAISKLTWSFLFFPYFLHARKRLNLTTFRAVGLSLILVTASFLLYNQLAAPYPNFATELLTQLGRSIPRAIELALEHIWFNLGNFIERDHRLLWLMLRLQMIICLGWAGFLLWKRRDSPEDWKESSVIVAGAGSLVILTILLYDVFGWRDYRLFAPVILLCSLILISRERRILVGLLIIGNLLVLPDFIAAHELVFARGRFPEKRENLEQFIEEISPLIQYDEEKSSWQNTVLVPLSVAINPLVIGIPEGVGISWFKFADQLPRMRSGYAILDIGSYQFLRQRNNLSFVKRTALGDLYINRNAENQGPGHPSR
ncbi:MAG: hypothetical protein P8Q97_09335 [Myxococcota bacterium]|jgi:hypothetical protein|nr:hypothetical protein [Myxococcota bacterium]